MVLRLLLALPAVLAPRQKCLAEIFVATPVIVSIQAPVPANLCVPAHQIAETLMGVGAFAPQGLVLAARAQPVDALVQPVNTLLTARVYHVLSVLSTVVIITTAARPDKR